MLLKINNLKSTSNLKHIIALSISLFAATGLFAQEIIEDTPEETVVKDSIQPFKESKIDGVAAVIGEFIVLDSDIDKTELQIKAQGGDPSNFTRCELFGKLLEDKLYAHHAIQDSIVVSDAEIRSFVNQQVEQFKLQFKGDLSEVLDFYKKDTEKALKDEMFEINKGNKLASEMQKKIIDEVASD